MNDDPPIEVSETPPLVEIFPNEVLFKIFYNLGLDDRCKASQVCRRWYSILHSKSCNLPDIVVFNIFEETVWNQKLSDNRSLRITTYNLKGYDQFRELASLVGNSCSVKIWYKNNIFADECLEAITESGIRLKAIDLFPYTPADMVLDKLHHHMPNLNALTMRPHGERYFFEAVLLPPMPNFSAMSTLVLENCFFMNSNQLPESLTTLEFSDREEKQFRYLELLSCISHLKNLEYFSVSHASILEVEQFAKLLEALDIQSLPKLSYVTFRYCRFPATSARMVECLEGRKLGLKCLRIELCYGSLISTIRCILEISPALAILVWTAMTDIKSIHEVLHSTDFLAKRSIYLHLSLLERGDVQANFRRDLLRDMEDYEVPQSFGMVVSKFEASFVNTCGFFNKLIIDSDSLKSCYEMKFIQCNGLSDQHVEAITMKCPRLRKLTMIGCSNTGDQCVMPFIDGFEALQPNKVEIIWKRRAASSRPASFYLGLQKERDRLKGKRTRFFTKQFSPETDGEGIIIWNENNRILVIKDFGDGESNRVVGVILPSREEENEVAESTSTTPSTSSESSSASLSNDISDLNIAET